MSQISKALRKIQESRQSQPKPKVENIIYLKDAPETKPNSVLMVLFTISSTVAALISITAIVLVLTGSKSKEIEVFSLKNTIKIQQKEINDLTILFNKTKKISDSQTRDLDFRINKEAKDFKLQINHLASTNKEIYDNLKEAIVDDKQQISFLNDYTNGLKKSIDKVSAAENQAKDLLSPASGN